MPSFPLEYSKDHLLSSVVLLHLLQTVLSNIRGTTRTGGTGRTVSTGYVLPWLKLTNCMQIVYSITVGNRLTGF